MSKQIDKLNIGLSQIDKKILKILLAPNGLIKSTKKYIYKVRNSSYNN